MSNIMLDNIFCQLESQWGNGPTPPEGIGRRKADAASGGVVYDRVHRLAA